jgi:predicted nucleic acid-binding protein
VIVVTEQHVAAAADLSLQHGFLTNDALLLVLMQSQGLTRLVSNDADFDRMPGITRYAPL